ARPKRIILTQYRIWEGKMALSISKRQTPLGAFCGPSDCCSISPSIDLQLAGGVTEAFSFAVYSQKKRPRIALQIGLADPGRVLIRLAVKSPPPKPPFPIKNATITIMLEESAEVALKALAQKKPLTFDHLKKIRLELFLDPNEDASMIDVRIRRLDFS